jgi:hypothetical protein
MAIRRIGARRGAIRAPSTLIQSAKLNSVDPQAWLADILAHVADTPRTKRGIGAARAPAPTRCVTCALCSMITGILARSWCLSGVQSLSIHLRKADIATADADLQSVPGGRRDPAGEQK